MPASGNNDSTNVFNNLIQSMSTQYNTLKISHVKGRTFEKHLNYIPRTNLLQIRTYLHTKKQEMKT